MKVLVFIIGFLLSFISYSQLNQDSINQSKTHYNNIIVPDSIFQKAPRHAIYGEFNVLYLYGVYERLYRLNKTVQFSAGAGIGLGLGYSGYGEYPLIIFLKPSFLVGGPKHNLEFGTFFTPQRRSWGKFSPHLGYRLVKPGGFIFRAEIVLIMQFEKDEIYPHDEWVDIFPLPGIAIGKTF
ncbi:hypothetical protein [Mangrovivirga cuniculi]|uniref:Uncharacterized protein n=1 Tax=Mangrovivirga cuniculi TaxID=2715131 RepID=A0A4D7JDG5_9BACT|nr:hypothetical protein [Mangrovivirga cuniculi]QCK13293.1 hypothetical protein DCC35_00280 [Mangrovivirga cuniculi]